MLLLAAAILFWSDPGNVSAVDFTLPAQGVASPAPAFRFMEEIRSGTSAKVLIRDGSGIEWQVKGGPEGRADAFATRFVSALGYYADAVLFIAHGHIEAVPAVLDRASGFIGQDGTFTWAAFERRDPASRFLNDRQWKWSDARVPEARALRILVMLLSNWDNKDATNFLRGPNTGFIETKRGTFAYVTDWGQSMGSWGFNRRTNWDCEGYKRQTPDFIRSARNGRVRFGYVGQHTRGFADGITTEEVRWLMKYLGQITDAQVRAGLTASGATRHEEECFAQSLRTRIETLRRIATLR